MSDFEELALKNMYLGCFNAILKYEDPCVSVTWPYISSCAYSKRRTLEWGMPEGYMMVESDLRPDDRKGG